MLKPCITEEKGGRDNVKEIRREGEREREGLCYKEKCVSEINVYLRIFRAQHIHLFCLC